MFSIDFEEKQDSLNSRLNYMIKNNTIDDLKQPLEDLKKCILNMKSFHDIMKIEEELNHYNEILGDVLSSYDPFEEDDESDSDVEAISEYSDDSNESIVSTDSKKHVTFLVPSSLVEKSCVTSKSPEKSKEIGYKNIYSNCLDSLSKNLDILQKASRVKTITLSSNVKPNLICLLRDIELTIQNPETKYKWFNIVNEYQDISDSELAQRFCRNSIYELDLIIQNEKIAIMSHDKTERIIDYLHDYEDGILISNIIDIETKVDELLESNLLKHYIISIFDNLFNSTKKLTIRSDKISYLVDEIVKLHKLICKTETDYHNKNLLKILLETY